MNQFSQLNLRKYIVVILLTQLLLIASSYGGWFSEDAPTWNEEEIYKVFLDEFKVMLEKKINLGDIKSKINLSEGNDNLKLNLRNTFNILYGNQASGSEKLKSKDQYNLFLQSLRQAVSSPEYIAYQNKVRQNKLGENNQNELINLLHEVVLTYFSETSMNGFSREIVNKMSKAGGYKGKLPQAKTDSTMKEKIQILNKSLHSLDEIYNAIKNAPSDLKVSYFESAAKNLRSSLSFVDFDPYLDGNIPSFSSVITTKNNYQDKLKGGTKCLRMGTPTIGSNDQTRITPEFMAYIFALKSKGQTHTYINYQNAQQPTGAKVVGIEDERPRATRLANFSEENNLNQTLILMTLPKNTNWYWQKGEIYEAPKIDGLDFLEDYFHQMFEDDNSGFYFPPAWRKADSMENRKIKGLVRNLYGLIFMNKNTDLEEDDGLLTIEERKAFIEISYLFIAQMFSANSYSTNKTCKDGIDRGAGAVSLEQFFLNLINIDDNSELGTLNFNEQVENLTVSVFAPALNVRQREIKDERLHRFKETAIFLLKKVEENPELVNQFKLLTPMRHMCHVEGLSNQEIKDSRF